jgi:hypothetical protein
LLSFFSYHYFLYLAFFSLFSLSSHFSFLLSPFSFLLSPFSPSLLFSGWLHKIGGKVRNWKRRYFILKDEYLYYFSSDNPTSIALGSVHLLLSEVKTSNIQFLWKRTERKETYVMEVVTSGRTYYLRATSKGDMEDWEKSLRDAIYSGE